MNLYIQIQNGQPVNHPCFEENLLQAFGSIPSDWEPFVRVERPACGVYEKLVSEQPVYAKVNGKWSDVWSVRNMTPEEKSEKQKKAREAYYELAPAENWATWILDEATCTMKPPIPQPAPVNGKVPFWCGAENNWKEPPSCPNDGKIYKFDYLAWTWVAIA